MSAHAVFVISAVPGKLAPDHKHGSCWQTEAWPDICLSDSRRRHLHAFCHHVLKGSPMYLAGHCQPESGHSRQCSHVLQPLCAPAFNHSYHWGEDRQAKQHLLPSMCALSS